LSIEDLPVIGVYLIVTVDILVLYITWCGCTTQGRLIGGLIDVVLTLEDPVHDIQVKGIDRLSVAHDGLSIGACDLVLAERFQLIPVSLEIADNAYVLDDGNVVYSGLARELAADEARVRALAGASAEEWTLT